jgi:ABC-type transporter Mla subunit MlaD
MTTTMIVMEPGSDWPGPVGDYTDLVAFGHGCEDLVRRTQEKLGVLQRTKQAVRVAVLACNDLTGDVAGHRATLARTLLRAVASATCGRLILSASRKASPRLLRELLALSEALAEELRGTTATVSLRLVDGSRAATPRSRRGATF